MAIGSTLSAVGSFRTCWYLKNVMCVHCFGASTFYLIQNGTHIWSWSYTLRSSYKQSLEIDTRELSGFLHLVPSACPENMLQGSFALWVADIRRKCLPRTYLDISRSYKTQSRVHSVGLDCRSFFALDTAKNMWGKNRTCRWSWNCWTLSASPHNCASRYNFVQQSPPSFSLSKIIWPSNLSRPTSIYDWSTTKSSLKSQAN